MWRSVTSGNPLEYSLQSSQGPLGVSITSTGVLSLYSHEKSPFESVVNIRPDGDNDGDVRELKRFKDEFFRSPLVVRPVIKRIFERGYDGSLPLMAAAKIEIENTRERAINREPYPEFCLARRYGYLFLKRVVIDGPYGTLRMIHPKELKENLEYIKCNGSDPADVMRKVLEGDIPGAWVIYDPLGEVDRKRT